MKDSKNLVIGLLCAVVCVMSVAFAAFSTQLNVSGTAGVGSTWDIKLGGVSCTVTPVSTGTPITNVGPAAPWAAFQGVNEDETAVTVGASLVSPGDSATCTIEMVNDGSLAAKVSTLSLAGMSADGVIQISYNGIAEGTKLAAGETKTFTVTMTYNSNITTQPDASALTASFTIAPTFVQDFNATGA